MAADENKTQDWMTLPQPKRVILTELAKDVLFYTGIEDGVRLKDANDPHSEKFPTRITHSAQDVAREAVHKAIFEAIDYPGHNEEGFNVSAAFIAIQKPEPAATPELATKMQQFTNIHVAAFEAARRPERQVG